MDRALQIRNASLEALRTRGIMTQVGGLPGRTQTATLGDLKMMYRTPFQRLPAASKDVQYTRALLKQRGQRASRNLEYGLDIWEPGGKVFNFEWSQDDEELQIVAFKRGPWEDVLLNSASPAMAAPNSDSHRRVGNLPVTTT
jgi:hypothetical protein